MNYIKSFKHQICYRLALLFGLSTIVFLAYGQNNRGIADIAHLPKPYVHYQDEYQPKRNPNDKAWSTVGKGMQVSFATTDKGYLMDEVPAIGSIKKEWAATGWKGERINMMILVWSVDTLRQLRVEVADLVHSNKKDKINQANVKTQLVRYVLSDRPYGAEGFDCKASLDGDAYLMPDRLEQLDRVDLPAKTCRPILVSFDLPRNSLPGTYTAEIKVKSTDEEVVLKTNIKIQGLLLPEPKEWSYKLDLWQNPLASATFNHVAPWSKEHEVLLKQHLKLYAEAGGKFITTYAVHAPWAGRAAFLDEGGMIAWLKKADGSWSFDYSLFDRYVNLAMEAGIQESITIYSPIPWDNRFRYMDEKTGNYVFVNWKPNSPAYNEVWTALLKDLRLHLKEKGWFKKTYIGINESTTEQTISTIALIKKDDKDWRITYAGNWHAELDPLLDDYCVLFGNEPPQLAVEQRKQKGLTTTYYVCCNPPKPNNFVFSPPAEGRWISWYAAAYGYDGFLRWAYDSWPADIQRDARYTSWPAGDCFLVYPGGNSSIRFEKLREGIVDYEKIKIIKAIAAKHQDVAIKKLGEELDSFMKRILVNKGLQESSIADDLKAGAQLIEKISDRLTL